MMSDIVIDYEEAHYPIEKPVAGRFHLPDSEDKPGAHDEDVDSPLLQLPAGLFG